MSERIDWPAMMRIGIRQLGLSPDAFWSLTPAEYLLLAGRIAGTPPLTRAGFDALRAAYPDLEDSSHGGV